MIQVMIVVINYILVCHCLKDKSLLMLTELPGKVTEFEQFFQLEYSESYTCNMHGDARIEGYHYCICHWVQHLKHSWL